MKPKNGRTLFLVQLMLLVYSPVGAASYTLGGVVSVGSRQGLGAFGNPAYLSLCKTGTALTGITMGTSYLTGAGDDHKKRLSSEGHYKNSSSLASAPGDKSLDETGKVL